MKPPPDAIRRARTSQVPKRPGAGRPAAMRGLSESERRRRRAQEKAQASRAVLLQCERCGQISTGRVTQRGNLVSQGMRLDYGRHTICAGSGARCGGDVRAFDIIGDAA